jgi:hypothetical protein
MEDKPEVEVVHQEDISVHCPPAEDSRPWYQQPELRKLYLLMHFLFLGSTTLGSTQWTSDDASMARMYVFATVTL